MTIKQAIDTLGASRPSYAACAICRDEWPDVAERLRGLQWASGKRVSCFNPWKNDDVSESEDIVLICEAGKGLSYGRIDSHWAIILRQAREGRYVLLSNPLRETRRPARAKRKAAPALEFQTLRF